eukprot:TRINITY_DN5086_c0_g2_i7.p1 TRINITY_DN5086_c0_g2~~TRINITY_DN5086_c0_g2_i7.p1  ORF type:complete len:156 (-),score=24.45 TRINITY_DN5086_c0_g2_i7:60-461(-)
MCIRDSINAEYMGKKIIKNTSRLNVTSVRTQVDKNLVHHQYSRYKLGRVEHKDYNSLYRQSMISLPRLGTPATYTGAGFSRHQSAMDDAFDFRPKTAPKVGGGYTTPQIAEVEYERRVTMTVEHPLLLSLIHI